MAETTYEEKKAIILDKIRILRLLDDTFMTKCFEGNIECVELLLHIILDKPDLIVKSATTQYNIKNLQGRSGCLDIHAVDSKGKKYNIEVERGDKVNKHVNGAYKEEAPNITPLGKLIHDFNCINASDMYYPVLAERVRYFKEDAKGVADMCKVVEDLINENKKESALKFIEIGKMTLEEIADGLGLSVEEVKALVNGA